MGGGDSKEKKKKGKLQTRLRETDRSLPISSGGEDRMLTEKERRSDVKKGEERRG